MTTSNTKSRARKSQRGITFLQVAVDPQTRAVLEELKKRLRAKRQTGKIVKWPSICFSKGSLKQR